MLDTSAWWFVSSISDRGSARARFSGSFGSFCRATFVLHVNGGLDESRGARVIAGAEQTSGYKCS